MVSESELRRRIELLENQLDNDYDHEWEQFKAIVTKTVKGIDEFNYRDDLEFHQRWNSAHVTVPYTGMDNRVEKSSIDKLDDCGAGVDEIFLNTEPLGLTIIVKEGSEEE